MKIPLTRPMLGREEQEAAADVIRSGWLVAGPSVAKFESAVAARVGAPHAVACANGTCALEIALRVLGIAAGDEVIVPSFTWIACPNAVRAVGAEVVFCDVDPQSFNMTPETVTARITERTRAIMVVHQFGLPADLDAIGAVAADRGLVLVEDAACALGSRYRGRAIGSAGNLACFSFHPRKVLTTGEGGMLAIADSELATAARRLIDHGSPNRDVVGHNYRLTDIQGAIGAVQMSRLDDVLAGRAERAHRYTEALSDVAGLVPPAVASHSEPNWQSYVVRIEDGSAVSRDGLAQVLREAEIASRAGTIACHTQPAYRTGDDLPVSEKLAVTSLALPLYPDMELDAQDRVIDVVLGAVSS